MKQTRRDFVKLLGGAALGSGVLLAGRGKAQGQSASPKGVPSGPIKIGLITLLTGTGAMLGVPGLRGAEMWQERANAAGGILGRKVEFLVEEETSPKETVEKFRKLTLQNKVDVVIGGISTAVGLAIGPVAEDMGQLWLAFDATTQKGVEETMSNPKFSFRCMDNEWDAIAGAIMTAKYYPDVVTVAGINNDYSYGRDCWDTYKAALSQLNPKTKFVLELWPKLGETEFSSHIATIKKTNPDLLMCSFWGGDNAIFFKQSAGSESFRKMKGCFLAAGMGYYTLKKDFTPEGIIIGFNCFYFKALESSSLGRWFLKRHMERYKELPGAECDNSWFILEAYKSAIEKWYALTGKWPTKEQLALLLPGTQVLSLSGYRGYTQDRRMTCHNFQGISTHKNSYDFITLSPMETFLAHEVQKPAGVKLYDWIKSWKA